MPKHAARGRILAACAILVAAFGGYAMPAQALPMESSISLESVSPDVATQWFSTSAPDVLRREGAGVFSGVQVRALTLGAPIAAYELDPQGGVASEPSAWVAGVYNNDEPAGSLELVFDEEMKPQYLLISDATMAERLRGLQSDQQIVIDSSVGSSKELGAWFIAQEGVLEPLDSQARSVLAGNVSLKQYAQLRNERARDTSAAASEPVQNKQSWSMRDVLLTVSLALIAIAVLVALALALREPAERVVSRVRAQIKAEREREEA